MNLYPFQDRLATVIAKRYRAYLRAPCRSGKTPILITAAVRAGAYERPVVICPPIAMDVWRQHWQTWAPGLPAPMVLRDDMLDEGLRELVLDSKPTVCIVDEAHRHKNTAAQRTIGALSLANGIERVWLASATPCPNHHGEFYAPLRAVWPDELRALGIRTEGAYQHFFCVTRSGPYGRTYVVPDRFRNLPVLRELLEKVIVAPTEDELKEFPKLRWVVEELPVSVREGSDIAMLGPDALDVLQALQEGRDPQEEHLSTLRRLYGEIKAAPAAHLIGEELTDRQYDKVVVVAYHHRTIDVLFEKLKKFRAIVIDGRTPSGHREALRQAFQSGDARVAIVQVQAAGMSIDLSAADVAIQVESTWVPEDDKQAVSRILKIGKTRSCVARTLVAHGTLDVTLERSKARKLRGLGETVYFQQTGETDADHV